MADRPDITSLNRDELAQLESQLITRFEELQNAEATDEVTAEMAAIADQLPEIGNRLDHLAAVEKRREDATRAVEAAQQRREAERHAAEQAEQQRVDETTSAQPVTTLTPVDTHTTTETTTPATEVVTPAETTPSTDLAVAASADQRVPSVADIANRAPAPQPPVQQRNEWYRILTAGAEISGLTAGSRFSSSRELADALVRRTESIAVLEGERTAMVARAHLENLGDPVTRSESSSAVTTRMLEAIQQYTDNRDRTRETLTASGGWCAPSETLWDLCEPEVADQLVSLPEISITRGGIQFFPAPDMSDFDPFLWGYCENELQKGVEKPCPEIPCPEPIEERACVEGACAKVGLLMAKAFPEWVERFIRGILVAHAVRISAVTLARMEAGSTPVIYTQNELAGMGVTAALLNAIEAQVEDLRADYFLGLSENFVIILPRWIRGAIRADLANRMGVDMLTITDQRIDDLLRSRGISTIQWVKGWQTEHIGAPGAQKAYPDSVRFLIYREGAWVRGLEPVIEIDTMYDSELLKRNQMTRIFTEQGMLVANICTNSRVVTVPVCPSGATHCGNPITCFAEITGSEPTDPDEGSGEDGDGEGESF